MKKTFFIFSVLIFGVFGFRKKTEANKSGPQLFGKFIVSTEDDEFGAVFTPDGKSCYFTKRTGSTLKSSVVVICVSHFVNGQWGEPEIASFSGKYEDFNPAISPDGTRLFFISNRHPGEWKKRFDTDIWTVKKSGEGWTEPENVGSPVNTAGWELGCSVARDGTLYFSSTGTTGNIDLYSSKWLNGYYEKPDTLGVAVNSPYVESDPFIAADGSYLLFSSQGRPDGLVGPGADANYPRGDLYISFRKDGKWTPAKNLGAPFNTEAEESNPAMSSDGKKFYFTSERNFVSIPMSKPLTYPALEHGLHQPGNGLGDIYEVTASDLLNKFN